MCFALLFMGCATSSPFNQEFVEVRTPNFVLTSSLGDGPTRELARHLEFFHTGVIHAMGVSQVPTAAAPTQVFAFDGRSLTRPFAVRGEAAYLIPGVDAPTWVFRAAGSFDERATPDLRHRYAHRILRDRSAGLPPLWLEEGNAQLARSIDVENSGAQVGLMDPVLRRFLLDWRRTDFDRVLRLGDVSSFSKGEREIFEIQAWAIVHTLRFGGPRRASAIDEDDRRVLSVTDRGARDRAVERLAARGPELARRIYATMEEDRQRVSLVGMRQWRSKALELTPLSPAEARARLGSLALQLNRPGLAKEYFGRALKADADHAVSHAGLARVAAMEGRAELFDEHVARGCDGEAERVEVLLRCGDAFLARSEALDDRDGEARKQAAERARGYYRSSLAFDRGNALARVGVGATYLVDGGDPSRAADWLEAARVIRPGSLEIQLFIARLEAQVGRGRAALIRARDIVSRTHWPMLEKRARTRIAEWEAAIEASRGR